MQIKSSGVTHMLYRYNGLAVEGDSKRTSSARIGSVLVGTAPDAIAGDLQEDLTPRELRELQQFLTDDLARIAREKLTSLRESISSSVPLLTRASLDAESIQALASEVSAFQAALRRVQRGKAGPAAKPSPAADPSAAERQTVDLTSGI